MVTAMMKGRNHPFRRSEITQEVVGFIVEDLSQAKEWVFCERINKDIPEKRQEYFF